MKSSSVFINEFYLLLLIDFLKVDIVFIEGVLFLNICCIIKMVKLVL